MISKELLSQVLGIDSKFLDQKPTCIEYECAGVYRFINIYELAYKCKEWAFMSKNYIMVEYEDRSSVFSTGGILVFTSTLEQLNDYIFNPNRVFKACQWILDNKEAN